MNCQQLIESFTQELIDHRSLWLETPIGRDYRLFVEFWTKFCENKGKRATPDLLATLLEEAKDRILQEDRVL